MATWFYVGRLPVAPGTWGSLAALPIGAGLLYLGGWLALAAVVPIIFLLGVWASAVHQSVIGAHDPGEIVVDEVSGQLIALLPASLSLIDIGLGFVLFRFFDIVKPWPASWADRELTGGMGVMLDDVVAGIYAALALCLVGAVAS